MINNTILNKLNNTHFGSDINKAEIFLKYFDKASYVSDLRSYQHTYDELRKLLKEIKPESLLFTMNNDDSLCIQDKYDFNTESYIRNDIDIIDSKASKKYDEIKNSIKESKNFVCITYVEGINIKCIYMNGYIYKIYLCNKSINYKDVTNVLKCRIPSYIDELSKYELVGLIGKATIFRDKANRLDLNSIQCLSMYYIENNIGISNVDIVFDNIIFSNNYANKLDNLWDRIEYMRTLNINVAHHTLIRDIQSNNLDNAIDTYTKYINDIDESNGISYNYSGLELRELEDLELKKVRFIYRLDISEDSIFESTVKSFKTSYIDNKIFITANIVSVKHNGKDIEAVVIDDICKIDDYGIQIGKKIKFKIQNGTAVIV